MNISFTYINYKIWSVMIPFWGKRYITGREGEGYEMIMATSTLSFVATVKD